MNDMANLFKAFSDSNRINIIKRLIAGETCGCTLITNMSISQPTLSYHLKILNDLGITKAYKEGTWVKHHVDMDVIDQMVSFLNELKETQAKCGIE